MSLKIHLLAVFMASWSNCFRRLAIGTTSGSAITAGPTWTDDLVQAAAFSLLLSPLNSTLINRGELSHLCGTLGTVRLK